jgi:CubicO group peptidase (beta-lactamase class C family)
LQSKGLIDLNDPINKYLDGAVMEGLHSFKGKDYSKLITVRNLMAHTSGLPDYFQQKDLKGLSLIEEITKGRDRSWNFEDVINYNKTLKPLFYPDKKGKAHYSDTNFQLLGKIIENIRNKSFAESCYDIVIEPLELKKTYLYNDVNDSRPKNLYFKNNSLYIPKAMSSFGPDGGIVSTSSELLSFVEAFFKGKFFPADYISKLKVWNSIFFPMKSGIGIHLFKLPFIFNPFGTVPEMIGHSGLSGALAYYAPSKNIFIAGTVNQIAYPDLSFRMSISLLQTIGTK